ncbi:hypothetical protein AB0K74_04510 [Streptomyces sp. NPDC056159]|uniref:hypothetical protein n=1 Tax=Streptomyces sp. NPDC056159 TaxID=3155537 RepID=UPI0034304DCF
MWPRSRRTRPARRCTWHNTALREALDQAATEPVLAPLVHAVEQVQGGVQPV